MTRDSHHTTQPGSGPNGRTDAGRTGADPRPRSAAAEPGADKRPRAHGEAPPLASSSGTRGDRRAGAPRGAAALSVAERGKRFGVLFEGLDRFEPPDAGLIALGGVMLDAADGTGDNPGIPAGFTYLGQFVDHDITFDKTSGFPRITDPTLIEQGRTPSLDLDSVYGLGPRLQPVLYEDDTDPDAARLKIGATAPGESSGLPGSLPNDLPRNLSGAPVPIDPSDPASAPVLPNHAFTGDPRNDENLIIAQLHLQFLKLHNKVLDALPAEGSTSRFERARELVRWHYQFVVLHDFVRRVCAPAVFDDVIRYGRRFYQPKGPGEVFMPVEFSVAAYRLGHSMVRDEYNYNRFFRRSAPGEPVGDVITPATLGLLFQFTGGGGSAPIPSNWMADWRRLFDVDGSAVRGLINSSRALDATIARALRDLAGFPAGEPNALAVRNLLRGSRVGLPHAQAVAEAMGIAPLSPVELTQGPAGPTVAEHGFDRTTPLWFYVLKEAEARGDGAHLGELGSRIVAEVFVGLLDEDPSSFRHAERRGWQPEFGRTMAELLAFVGDVNPVGDPAGVV